jgi:hypothetical protein
LPITFLWLKDGTPLGDELALLVKLYDEFSTSLTFPKITTLHNGNYTCVARNAAASTNYSTTLTVEGKCCSKLIQSFNYSVLPQRAFIAKRLTFKCFALGEKELLASELTLSAIY